MTIPNGTRILASPKSLQSGEGKKYFADGLEFVKKGGIDNAIECFYHAAVILDRSQESKLIPALWESIEDMIEPDFKEKHSDYFDALHQGNVNEVYSRWFHFPLMYCTDACSEYEWNNQTNKNHRQSWAYEWAGKHVERLAQTKGSTAYRRAYRLFARAAEKAEQTEDAKKYPEWPAKLWYLAVHNYIHAFGTTDDAVFDDCTPLRYKEARESIIKMRRHYLQIQEKDRAYKMLANAYGIFESALAEMGNLAESEQFRKEERSALVRYYFYKKHYSRAIIEWLSGDGFLYFIVLLFIMILIVFPLIYYQYALISSPSDNKVTYLDAIVYSVELALSIDHGGNISAIGYGKLLNITEASLSWLGLGIFIWWLTRRLE